jgi:Ca2+-binding RTX toxin-like protein
MAVRAWIGSATVVAVVSAASIVVAGSPAHAGPGPMPTVEVRVIGGLKQLTYIDKAGGASRVRIRSTWVDVIVDEAYPISIISGCTHPTPSDATLVLCPGPFHAVIVATGDGDDFIDDLPSAPAILWSGLTQVTAGPGNDRVIGSGFVDVLTGGEGDDVLDGWSGNDVLVGGTGADEMHGGAGVDRVEYFDHDVGVTISNDGVVFNDGQPGEQDTIYGDVENLVGGPRDDILIGNDGANKLQGGAGNDALYGNGGDDVLVGGADGETITAVAVAPYEADLLDGGYGNDTVSYDVWGGTLGVTVDLDDETGDDGAPGEGTRSGGWSI